jgi:hypothetical protein
MDTKQSSDIFGYEHHTGEESGDKYESGSEVERTYYLYLIHKMKNYIKYDNIQEIIKCYQIEDVQKILKSIDYYVHPFNYSCMFNSMKCLKWIFENDSSIYKNVPIAPLTVGGVFETQDMQGKDTYRIIEYSFEVACTNGCIDVIQFIASKNILNLYDKITKKYLLREIITHMTFNYKYNPNHIILKELFKNFTKEQLNIKRSEILYKGINLTDIKLIKMALSDKYIDMYIPEEQYNGNNYITDDSINYQILQYINNNNINNNNNNNNLTTEIKEKIWNKVKDDIMIRLIYYGYYTITKRYSNIMISPAYNCKHCEIPHITRKYHIYDTILKLFIRAGYIPNEDIDNEYYQYYKIYHNTYKYVIEKSIKLCIHNNSNTYGDLKNINSKYTILPYISKYI